jgi:hypothetical protein
MSSASFYKWRAKFGGMDASLMSEMKDMAEEALGPRTKPLRGNGACG